MTPTSDWGRGSWMQTYTGRQFYPLDARPDDIDPVDIAHALSQICRYGGHTRRFYSVAEHGVYVSHAVAPANALWGLLHDAAEAYVGDMVRPLKHHMPEYRAVEDRLLGVIAERFGLALINGRPGELPPQVKEADNRILLDERDALLTAPPAAWNQERLQPLGITIAGHDPVTAETLFLGRLAELWTDGDLRHLRMTRPDRPAPGKSDKLAGRPLARTAADEPEPEPYDPRPPRMTTPADASASSSAGPSSTNAA